MLDIKQMQLKYLKGVKNLKVGDNQLKFVGTIEEILKYVNLVVHAHVIILQEQILGFFLVDTKYSENYNFASLNCLSLRAYFISNDFQGKGYGKRAVQLLPSYLKSIYPNQSEIYLTVNCKNLGAKHCYLNGGFSDTNELYHGGEAGPQYIMNLKLDKNF